MSCVNIRHPEFKAQAERLNISVGQLRNIVHEYQNTEGNEFSFPPDTYVESKLQRAPNIVDSAAQEQLWEKKFKKPSILNTRNEVDTYVKEASKYFDSKSVIIKELPNGRYEVKVGKPVREDYEFDLEKSISLKKKPLLEHTRQLKANEWNLSPETIKAINDKLENYMDTKEGKIQDSADISHIFPKETTTAKEALTAIAENSVDEELRLMAQYLLKNIGKNGDVVLTLTQSKFGPRGTYSSASNSIKINRTALKGPDVATGLSNFESTILHEITHAITVKAIEENAAVRDMFLQIFKDYLGLQDQYGIHLGYAAKNAKEFIAEFFGRPIFREALMTIPYTQSKNKVISFGQKVINFILNKILGLNPKYTMYSAAKKAFAKVLQASNSREYATTDTIAEEYNIQYNGQSREWLINQIQDRIEVLKQRRDKIESAIYAFKQQLNIRFGHLLPPRRIGATRRYMKGYLKGTDIHITLTDDGRFICTELANIESELSFLIDPRTPDTIIDAFFTPDAVARAEEEKRILELLGKEDYEEDSTENVDSELERFAKQSAQLKHQLNNLSNSDLISYTEVQNIAAQCVYWISDAITTYLQNPQLALDNFGEIIGIGNKSQEEIQELKVRIASMSRLEFVNLVGINNLITLCKESVFTPSIDDNGNDGRNPYLNKSFDLADKAEVIYDNFDAIIKIATPIFAQLENFSIQSSTGTVVESTDNTDIDNYNESNDTEDVQETRGSEQEHWQQTFRTQVVFDNMTAEVHRALQQCYVLRKTEETNPDGSPVYDYDYTEFGIKKRINAKDAVSSILKWTQGSITYEDMVSRLEAKVDKHPWLIQILDKLYINPGQKNTNADLQSQFFSVFCKSFQSYSIVIRDGDTLKSVNINELPALKEAVNTITTQFNIGEHPMFTPEGININQFNSFKEAVSSLNTLLDNKKKGGVKNTEGLNVDEIGQNLWFAAHSLGYYVTPEIIRDAISDTGAINQMMKSLNQIYSTLETQVNNKEYNPFDFKSKTGILGNLRSFLKPLTDQLEDTAVSSFYDNGKMYQSYVTPSYVTKLMNKFHLEEKAFVDFIQQEYGQYEWFKDTSITDPKRGWKNEWLRLLSSMPVEERTKIFKHKVELSYNKHNYMRDLNDIDYTMSLITEYFSETSSSKEGLATAWYRIPMMSNKPSSEFIKFYRYTGDFTPGTASIAKQSLIDGFTKIFGQELSRIQTVEMREEQITNPDAKIKNFDTNGKKFMFLDFLNDYLFNKESENYDSELASLVRTKLDGKKLTAEQENTLNLEIKSIIQDVMDSRVEKILETWKSQGIVKAAKNIANLSNGEKTDEETILNNMREFIWNDTFAAMNIMQLTITDIAYYKDAEDLQKRMAQIHAPGLRGNASATDYEGNPVSDGKLRTLYLTDFDKVKSNIIENVSVVFNRKLKEIEGTPQYNTTKALYDEIINSFNDINVADAQAFSSPTSYRKKALIFGNWSTESEEVYKQLLKGNINYTTLKTAFQVLKPFVYTQIDKPSLAEGAPLQTLKVGLQNKNSEYLLVMADAILQGENTGRPNLLRAIYRVMEDSASQDNTKGIDTIQFESAVKAGLMGRINLKPFETLDPISGEEAAYNAMMSAIGNSQEGYNSTYVHEIPIEDYCIQQPVPEHFRNHEQAHGSQIRYIMISDLVDIESSKLERVTYNFYDPKYGTTRELTPEDFRREYENTIAQNIQESLNELKKELHLTSSYNTTKERNIALSKVLQREILSNARYGVDLLRAVLVDEEGNFAIPLQDPIQAKRVEQLINSIIKNKVNKQKIAGGPVVQVSNFGTSRALNIRFKDKEGNLLKTREEYEKETTRLQSRDLVQSAIPRSFQISWQENSKGGTSDSKEKGASNAKLPSRGVHRDDNYVTRNVSIVSAKIDAALKRRGIKATAQPVRRASSQEFHDAITFAKQNNPNGWMVDVHDVTDYDNDLCMLTEDGKAGIAVTKDGDIISVFSAISKDFRLEKLMQMAIAAGGKKLDCYYQEVDGNLVGLPNIYARFGFTVDATTAFAEEYAPEEYKEWKEKNPNKKMAGVAAMSLKVKNSLDEYSRDRDSEIEKAPSFEGENGYSNMLEYRDSKLTPTQEETQEETQDSNIDLEQNYKNYIKENQSGIAYYEVFAPIYMNELFSEFQDANGNIDIATIEAINPDLLKMIGYRIPTEDKYSMAPLKIVGFLPREAGEGIMMPNDITLLTGSDFDVDKFYLMRKEIDIAKRFIQKTGQSLSEAEESYVKHNTTSLVKALYNKLGEAPTTQKERDAVVERVKEETQKRKEAITKKRDAELEALENRDATADTIIEEKEVSEEKKDKFHNQQDKYYERIKAKIEKRYEEALSKIESSEEERIIKALDKYAENKGKTRIKQFLEVERYLSATADNKVTAAIRKAYIEYMYKTLEPTSGTTYRNNKIIDMSWAVLTHEAIASQILSPGGFEEQKRMGYLVEAQRVHPDMKWETLSRKDIKALKELCYANKNLSFIDTHIQFYKQNSAAGTVLGAAAVEKVAHAVLSGDDLYLGIQGLNGTNPKTILGRFFGEDRMLIDPQMDTKGNLIGKTLGSLVAAAADAVKDPVLNLMNINSQTISILTTLIRLGVPFEDASLFLSQKAIGDLLADVSYRGLSEYTNLSTVLQETLDYLDEQYHFTSNKENKINHETLTKKELYLGITEYTPQLQYKILRSLQAINTLASELRKLTTATRLNSISTACGPLIIDNIIFEHKIDELSNSFIYNGESKGNTSLNLKTFLKDYHPILSKFYDAHTVAEEIFKDFPISSGDFLGVLQSLDEVVTEEIVPGQYHDIRLDTFSRKFMTDRKLLNDLGNFYQSYIFLQEGLVHTLEKIDFFKQERGNTMEYFIKTFPRDFMRGTRNESKAILEKYANNALIQAIRVNTTKEGTLVLELKLTGLDTQQKEILGAAWADLHKENPKLSTLLFVYNFFKAGVTFSPKSFLSLVPTIVKEQLPDYTESFKHKVHTPSAVVMDQFIRNNWENNKLVPRIKTKDCIISKDKTELSITQEELVARHKYNLYIKTKEKGEVHLYRRKFRDLNSMDYEEIDALGNNKEYLEMDIEHIDKAMHQPTLVETTIAGEAEVENVLEAEEPSAPPVTDKTRKELAEHLLTLIQGNSYTREQAISSIHRFQNQTKEKQEQQIPSIKELLFKNAKALGITTDETEVDKMIDLMC